MHLVKIKPNFGTVWVEFIIDAKVDWSYVYWRNTQLIYSNNFVIDLSDEFKVGNPYDIVDEYHRYTIIITNRSEQEINVDVKVRYKQKNPQTNRWVICKGTWKPKKTKILPNSTLGSEYGTGKQVIYENE